ncbi:MAG: alpha/beta fold hydrolase [Anaplasma sp.]
MDTIQEGRILVPYKEDFYMYYRLYNSSTMGDKTPLICVHGMGGNCMCFDYLGKAISDFPVILVDVVGRGKSSWLKDNSLYNYDTYCNSILHLAKYFDIKICNYLGTSMGGIIGMFLAARSRDVLEIKKLILNDIGPQISEKPLLELVELLTQLPTFDDKQQARKYFEKTLRNFGIKGEDQWNHIVENRIMERDGKYIPTLDPGIGIALEREVQQSQTGVFDIWDVWEQLECERILVLKGEFSNILTSDVLKKMLESKKNVDYIKYDGVGHVPSLLADSRIQDVKRWLGES